MKPSEIRQLSPQEIRQKIDEKTQELFNFQFQHAAGQLENTSLIKQTKRDIARLKTILREMESTQTTSES